MNKLFSKTKEETKEEFNIKYKKCPFSKSIRITLKNENNILVTMPYLCPFKTAREFLYSNFEKLKSYKFDEKKYYKNFKTKFDTLKIIKSDFNEIKTKDKIVYFYYNGDFLSSKIQKAFKEAYLKALKIEAKFYLPSRLEFLANKYNFNYEKIALKNQRTRFGSCSFKNNINLNINLMKYDFDVIDYVLIHELCHTRFKNHSKNFWMQVEKYCPNYKNLRKRLKTSL